MFLGEYQHSLDAKGRIILPSRFRARLAEGCVLTRGQENCVVVYPREEWSRIYDSLREAKQRTPQARALVRQMFSGAHEEVPDKQGRVMVPEHLRDWAKLEKDVAVIGVGERMEIWDAGAWTQEQRRTEDAYRNLDIDNPDIDF